MAAREKSNLSQQALAKRLGVKNSTIKSWENDNSEPRANRLSMLAGYFAQSHHAPNIRAMTEGGVYGATQVGGLPWGIECNRI